MRCWIIPRSHLRVRLLSADKISSFQNGILSQEQNKLCFCCCSLQTLELDIIPDLFLLPCRSQISGTGTGTGLRDIGRVWLGAECWEYKQWQRAPAGISDQNLISVWVRKFKLCIMVLLQFTNDYKPKELGLEELPHPSGLKFNIIIYYIMV